MTTERWGRDAWSYATTLAGDFTNEMHRRFDRIDPSELVPGISEYSIDSTVTGSAADGKYRVVFGKLQPGYGLGFDDLTYLDERYNRVEEGKDIDDSNYMSVWFLFGDEDTDSAAAQYFNPHQLRLGASSLLLGGAAATSAFLALNLF